MNSFIASIEHAIASGFEAILRHIGPRDAPLVGFGLVLLLVLMAQFIGA